MTDTPTPPVQERLIDELKPCPFCGCADIQWVPRPRGSGLGDIVCMDCAASHDEYYDKDEAVAAWNKRSVGPSAPISAGSIAPNPSLAPVSEEVVEEVAIALSLSLIPMSAVCLSARRWPRFIAVWPAPPSPPTKLH